MSDAQVDTGDNTQTDVDRTQIDVPVRTSESYIGADTGSGRLDPNRLTFRGLIPSQSVDDSFQQDADLFVENKRRAGALLSFATIGTDYRNNGLNPPLERMEVKEYLSNISGLSMAYVDKNFHDVASALYPNIPANPNKILDAKYILKNTRELSRDLTKLYESFYSGERTPDMQKRIKAYRQQLADVDTIIEALPVGPTKAYLMDKMNVIKEQYGINSPQMFKATLDA
jgi:hypothetical protein